MTDKFEALTRSVKKNLGPLRKNLPEVMKAFGDLGRTAMEAGEISAKGKELIAMALAVAARCDDCIGFHAQALARLGATRQEVFEAIGVAIYMGGGPSAMYAAHAVAAFDESTGTAAGEA